MKTIEHKAVFIGVQQQSQRAHAISKIMSKDPRCKFNGLRDFYRLVGNEIFDAGKSEWGIDCYEVDWTLLFTPIEYGLWYDIRDSNSVLYPQYPVGRFFVDFANPVAKVAIECDGYAYHLDKAKDASRQAEIESLGWTVYRITGRDCMSDFKEEIMESGVARKLISRIAERHGISRNSHV